MVDQLTGITSGGGEAGRFGYCPKCGGAGRMRERRPNGNDKCEFGHVYPSSIAMASPMIPQAIPSDSVIKSQAVIVVTEFHDGQRLSTRVAGFGEGGAMHLANCAIEAIQQAASQKFDTEQRQGPCDGTIVEGGASGN